MSDDATTASEERRAIAQHLVTLTGEITELRREHAETSAVMRDWISAQTAWLTLRTSIVTSMLTRPIQWAVAICVFFALGALIYRGRELDALAYATHLAPGGSTSVIVTGAPNAPVSSPSPTPTDGSTTTP